MGFPRMDLNTFAAVFGGQAGRSKGPIALTIDYTSTQFAFKFRLPVGKTVTLIWGDGTSEAVAGQGTTIITKTSSYASAGTYSFGVAGDVLSITYIDISAQAFVSGDVSGWSALTGLTVLRIFSTGVSGDISGWSALTSLTDLRVYSSSVTGSIAGWSVLTSMVTLYIHATSLSGDISALATLTSIATLWAYSTSVTFDTTTAWALTLGDDVRFQNNSWTSTMVDNAIAALKDGSGATINIAGTNAHRTSASNSDLNTLLANGNSITLNDVLGAELHTSLNAANDSATEAITAFADYSATIDGGVQVTQAQDISNMLPLGSELITNGDFANWTGDDPDDYTIEGTEDGTNYVTEDAGKANIVSDGTYIGVSQTVQTVGKYYLASIEVTAAASGSIKFGDNVASGVVVANAVQTYYNIYRAQTTKFICVRNAACDITIDNVSVKEIEVLGSDLVTNGSFTLGANLNVSSCINDPTYSYNTFDGASATGFHVISDGSGADYAGTADEISFVSGQKYTISFDLSLSSGTLPYYYLAASLAGAKVCSEAAQVAVDGHNIFEFTASSTTTGVLVFHNLNTATEYTISNLSVKNSTTDWTRGTGWLVVDGVASCDGSQTAVSLIYQTEAFNTGDVVLYKFTISNYSAGNIRVRYGFSPRSNWISANGTYTLIGINSDNYDFIALEADADFIGDIDNVSVHKLLVTKEIAASTNYTGDHYVLPEAGSDLDSFIIPVTYAAESIVAQVITGESNLTTGWTAINNCVLSVEETNVDEGLFAIEMESNTTPTSTAAAYIDLEAAPFSCTDTNVYRLTCRIRHVGSGGEWRMQMDNTTSGFDGYADPDPLDSLETTYESRTVYWTHDNDHQYLNFREVSTTNDGGIIIDNLSVKQVTLS